MIGKSVPRAIAKKPMPAVEPVTSAVLFSMIGLCSPLRTLPHLSNEFALFLFHALFTAILVSESLLGPRIYARPSVILIAQKCGRHAAEVTSLAPSWGNVVIMTRAQ